MRDDLLIRVAHSVEPEAFGSTSEAWAAAMNAAWDGDVDTPEVLEVQQAAASAGAGGVAVRSVLPQHLGEGRAVA